MSAYIVFQRVKTIDQESLDRYATNVSASFRERDVQFLATYGEQETLEGPPTEGTVILQFPDMASARDWYHSDAYQSAAKHRFAGSEYHATLVNGRSST